MHNDEESRSTAFIELWSRYLEVARDSVRMESELRRLSLADEQCIVELVRHSLSTFDERDVALGFVESLQPQAQKALFDVLLPLAAELDKGSINRAEQILLSLDRPWLRQKLEESMQKFLDPNDITPELLNLYFQVDRSLTRQLSERAAASDNADRRDLGEFFLQKLNEPGS
jgi:hypothetical protein